MAFVKLDCGILNSTLWVEREPRDVFITALLMAEPHEVVAPMPQYEVRSLTKTGFQVPPGWYGFVQAAGPGIVRRALSELEAGMDALEKLGSPDLESRSSDFEGRRLVRVDGGYIVLNYMKYREKDATSADRSKRYREKKKREAAGAEPPELPEAPRRDDPRDTRDSTRRVTIAEGEGEEEEIQSAGLSGGSPARTREGPEDPLSLRDPEDPDPPAPPPAPSPTAAGLACLAIRAARISDVNPSHPRLLALLAAGVTSQQLADTATELVDKGRGKFALLLATVEGRLRDAAQGEKLPAPPPARKDAWREDFDGIQAMRQQLGVPSYPDDSIDDTVNRVTFAWRKAGEPPLQTPDPHP